MAVLRERFEIPESRYGEFVEAMAELQKRAEKLGCRPAEYAIIGRETREIDGEPVGFNIVHVIGERPMLNDWRFMAVIEHLPAGNVLRVVPGEEVPSRFRTAEPWCDHCNSLRYRKDTYVVANEKTGEVKQVGSTCVKDFTGHKAPQQLAAFFEFLESMKSQEREWREGGGRGPGIGLVSYLTWTAVAIRFRGWTSRTVARETDKAATADIAFGWMLDAKNGEARYKGQPLVISGKVVRIEDEDRQLADQTLAWARTELEPGDNDYLWNLKVLLSEQNSGCLEPRDLGLAASAIAAYNRAREREQERAAAPVGGHVGEVGERIAFEGWKVTFSRVIGYNRWGTRYLNKFETPDGSEIVWFTDRDLEPGRVYSGTFRIMEHSEYNGKPQTTVSNPGKLVEMDLVAA